MPSVYCWADPLSDNPIGNPVYHTSICVDFKNGIKYVFSYNDKGLNTFPAGNQAPNKSHYLGESNKTLTEMIKHAYQMQSTQFSTYNPLTTNCNYFSNDLSVWLCGEIIPAKYILQSTTVITYPLKLVSCILGGSGGSSGSSGSSGLFPGFGGFPGSEGDPPSSSIGLAIRKNTENVLRSSGLSSGPLSKFGCNKIAY